MPSPRIFAVVLACLLVVVGLANAVSPAQRRWPNLGRDRRQDDALSEKLENRDAPAAEPQSSTFDMLLEAVSPDALHRILESNMPDRYRLGVFETARRAMEALHRESAPLASSLVVLAKRQDGGNTSTTTTTTTTSSNPTTTSTSTSTSTTTSSPPPTSTTTTSSSGGDSSSGDGSGGGADSTTTTTSDQPPPPSSTTSSSGGGGGGGGGAVGSSSNQNPTTSQGSQGGGAKGGSGTTTASGKTVGKTTSVTGAGAKGTSVVHKTTSSELFTFTSTLPDGQLTTFTSTSFVDGPTSTKKPSLQSGAAEPLRAGSEFAGVVVLAVAAVLA